MPVADGASATAGMLQMNDASIDSFCTGSASAVGWSALAVREAVARPTVAGEEVRHDDGADDLAGDQTVVVGCVDHLRHRVLGRRIAEQVERLVADVQHALAEVAGAGDGEVPRQVQLVPLDAGAGQRAERVLHGVASRLELVGEADAIAVGEEHRPGFERVARGIAEVAQADDEPVALREDDERVDDEQAIGVDRSAGIELGPQRDSLAGIDVDEHDRAVVGE